MKKEWIKYIICPECSEEFELIIDEEINNKIKKGTLCCTNNHTFSISNGIPVLLPYDIHGTQKETQESFSSKWTRSDEIKEYGHDEGVRKFQYNWYIQRYGWKNEYEFEDFISQQEFVLDAGCGVGRDTKWFSTFVKGIAFGIDISESIHVAKENLKNIDNIFLIQGDITRPPFRKDFFDFVSCDQVLHHTPNTHETFNVLVSILKKSGVFSTYTYKIKGPVREFSDDFIRSYAVNMSADECYELSKSITLLGKALSDLNVDVDIPEDIPLLKIEKGKLNIQRFVYWHMFKCFWNDDFGMERSIMTNFDWYHPKDAHRHTAEELKSWITECNLKILNFDVGKAGISIRVQKI